MMRLACVVAAAVVVTACSGGPTSDETGPVTADFSGYGAYRLGMTLEEVRTAANGELVQPPMLEGNNAAPGPCQTFIDADATSGPANRLAVLLLRDTGYRVVGIRVPDYARTSTGVGYGSTPAEVRAAYEGREVEESASQVGTEILVKGDGPDNYIGFTISADGNSIVALRVGTHDFAANYELCSGG